MNSLRKLGFKTVLVFSLLLLLFQGGGQFYSLFSNTTVAYASGGATIGVEAINYEGWHTDLFTVDGQIAYCYSKGSPTPYGDPPFGKPKPGGVKAKVRRALYYGWGGPGNVFSANQKEMGAFVTQAVIWNVTNGGSFGTRAYGYDKLWDKVQGSDVPDTAILFSDKNLSVGIKNGKQVSQTTKLKAWSKNRVKISVPSGLTIVNESTGKRVNGGTITIKGGQRFHLEASLSYNRKYNSGTKYGKFKYFQPLITLSNGNYQDLITYRYFKDPAHASSFTANFYPRTVTVTYKYRDRQTGQTFRTVKKTETIGQKYSYCASSNYNNDGVNELINSSRCTSGTVPRNNFTHTFWYTTKWNLKINYKDNHSGKVLSTHNEGNHKVGSKYSIKVPSSLSSGDTHYSIASSTTVAGTMPRHNVTRTVPYTPYNHIDVKWENKYSPHYVFKHVGKNMKVGQGFDYAPNSYFTRSGKRYDRTSSGHYRGTMGYNNRSHVFWYKLRRKVTVNYYDIRTGNKIRSTIQYNLHQGDRYSENYPTIKGSRFGINFTYDYVKETGSNQSGTVGTGNITINYYYKVPSHHVNVYWKNRYPRYDVFKHINDYLITGDYFKFSPNRYFKKNNKTYDRTNSKPWSGRVPNRNINHTFLYKLRRQVTVNYYDERTGEKIRSSKKYILHQGQRYSETHLTIKKDGLTYHYVKETGSEQSGTIGTQNVTINYFYNIPLAKIGLDKLQIYTALADKGLPVKVYLNKKLNYDKSVSDMKDNDKTITVSLYDGSEQLAKKTYTADILPDYLTFTVPAKGLTVHHHKAYTVKIEGYNPDDFKIESGRGRLTTNGYTSSQETFHVDVTKTQHLKKTRVIMTEITPTTSEKDYHEVYDFSFTKAPVMKTGYGLKNHISLAYTNELGDGLEVKNMTFQVPQKLIDSCLTYPTSSGQALIKMDKKAEERKDGTKEVTTVSYELPHVNVEKETGNLFSDRQRNQGDKRITKDLIDGGHKFYLPIWMDLGDYNVSSMSAGIGINDVSVKATDTIKVTAHMIETMDSNTKANDEILMMPVNADNPFPSGRPKGWTEADVKWIEG